MALPRQMPRLWPRHVVLSVANSVVPTTATHGNPRKLPWQFLQPSAAIATATRQSPRKPAEVRGNCHGNFRGRSIEAIFTAIRVHCHGDPPIRGDFHGSTWESAAIATACAAVLSVANSVVPIMTTAVRARGRESAVGLGVGVSMDQSMEVRESFRRQVRGCFRRCVRGCVRGRCRGCFRGRFPSVTAACRGMPWVLPLRLPWRMPWRLSWKLPWLVPRASTVLRYLPRHSVEARGMSVETRGRSAVARGVSAVVHGTPWTWPWTAVEVRGHCRGAPPKRQIPGNVHPSTMLRGHRRDAHEGLTAARGAAMWWLRL